MSPVLWEDEAKEELRTRTQQKRKNTIVSHASYCTSWYIDGLDRDGIVKERSLPLPSLSTISCENKKREEVTERFHQSQENRFLTACYTKLQPLVGLVSKCQMLISDSGPILLISVVWVTTFSSRQLSSRCTLLSSRCWCPLLTGWLNVTATTLITQFQFHTATHGTKTNTVQNMMMRWKRLFSPVTLIFQVTIKCITEIQPSTFHLE